MRQKFRRSLRPSDWTRFDRYSHRVRALQFDDRRLAVRRKALDQSIYDEITATRPRAALLPNLQTLSWLMGEATRQHRSLIVMHTGLHHLAIQLNKSTDPANSLAAYVQALVERAPGVSKLEIRSTHPVRDVQTEVQQLVRGLLYLKHLTLPMYFLNNEITAALASSVFLESITFAEPIEQGTGDRADVGQYAPVLEEGAFQSLRKLSFSAHLQHARAFVGETHVPTNITSLHINILAIDNPPVLYDLLVTVTRFRALTELVLDFVLSPGALVVWPPPPPVARPNLDTLRPLLGCGRLKKFEIRWDYQLNLVDADMGELARSWPDLEHLHLHSEPIPEPANPPTLTSQALIPFARHCPRLRYLGVYFDGDSVPSRAVASTESPHPFRQLRELSVGSSPVTVTEPTALYLSQLCPANCQLTSGVRWPDAYGIMLEGLDAADEIRVKMQQWWIRWGNIGKVLSLVVKARQDEKARVGALQREMESLSVTRERERERLEELEREVSELKGTVYTRNASA